MGSPLGRFLLDPRRGGLLALVLVIVVVQFLLSNNFHYRVAIGVGLAAIVCVGLNLLIGYAGQISLGHAGFFAIGAYSSAILTSRFGWPPLAGMAAGMAIAGAVSFLLARPILRLKGHYLAMATLGMGIIVSIIITREVGLTGGPDGMAVPGFSAFGLEIGRIRVEDWTLLGLSMPEIDISKSQVWYVLVGTALVLAVWLALNLVASPVGRALRALHGSEVAAAAAGIDTTRYKILVFVISALYASFAGSLFAHFSGYLSPADASFFRSIEFVVMVVFGGMASIFGSVIGAAVLTVLPQVLTAFQEYEHVVFGLLLMLTMIFMPKGLLPSLRARLARRRGAGP